MIAEGGEERKPIAELLMDQTMFAGIGNIFRAELLYRARVSPFRVGKDVDEKTLKVDMEGCRCVDAGGDGRSENRDDEAGGQAA